jgi:cobyrinic acid a,c-diamide synthase
MSSSALGPRLVVAGTHSGVGKTTVATGLIAALRAAGHRPATAKVGPDFIDPSYHALASGRPPRNLDAWICGVEAVPPLAARAGAGGDVLIVEGVMGLFDGAGDGTVSSTADVARLLEAPVLLVVDASAMSGSVAAVVHGYATLRPEIAIAGVVLNQVGSLTHEEMLRDALAPLGIPVLGALRRDDALRWRDRHLGLVPVAEQPDTVRLSLQRLADVVRRQVDLEGVVALARSAPLRSTQPVPLPAPGPKIRVAVAAGTAFTFTYTDTLEALEAAGAELVPFDPIATNQLPEAVDGLLVGGGFPEVHAAALSANRPLLDQIRGQVDAGLPTWAGLADRPGGHQLPRPRVPLLGAIAAWRGPAPSQPMGRTDRRLGHPQPARHLSPPPSGRRSGGHSRFRLGLCPTSYPTFGLGWRRCTRAACISPTG